MGCYQVKGSKHAQLIQVNIQLIFIAKFSVMYEEPKNLCPRFLCSSHSARGMVICRYFPDSWSEVFSKPVTGDAMRYSHWAERLIVGFHFKQELSLVTYGGTVYLINRLSHGLWRYKCIALSLQPPQLHTGNWHWLHPKFHEINKPLWVAGGVCSGIGWSRTCTPCCYYTFENWTRHNTAPALCPGRVHLVGGV